MKGAARRLLPPATLLKAALAWTKPSELSCFDEVAKAAALDGFFAEVRSDPTGTTIYSNSKGRQLNTRINNIYFYTSGSRQFTWAMFRGSLRRRESMTGELFAFLVWYVHFGQRSEVHFSVVSFHEFFASYFAGAGFAVKENDRRLLLMVYGELATNLGIKN